MLPSCTRARKPTLFISVGAQRNPIALRLTKPLARLVLIRNPSGKVPALIDQDFTTGESCTIVRYLSEKYGKWNLVPKDLKARTTMNAVLDEHHGTTRFGAARVFWFDYLMTQMGTSNATTAVLSKDAHTALRQALKRLESRLSETKAYLAGESVTFADMLSYSELKQLDLLAYDFSAYPALASWMKLMSGLPNHDQVFNVLGKLVAISNRKRAEAAKAKL